MAEDLLNGSPFTDKLNTNFSPSVDEVNEIDRLLSTPLKELRKLDEDVANARSVLDRIIHKQTRLQEAIGAHQALTSPIRRIPKEVLQEVFLRCLPSDHRPILSISQAPLLLTRICKPWRNLALSTPVIWSALHIPIPFTMDETNQLLVTTQRVEAVRRWLGMSGDTPLFISLFWPPRMSYSWGTGHRFPRTVISYSHRLRELELTLPDEELGLFADLTPAELPLLERIALYLKTASGEETRGMRISESTIWLAPRLNSVVWSHVHDDFLSLPLNWGQLVEISVDGSGMVPLSYFSVNDARALLASCPNLVKCSIQLTYYEDPRQPIGFSHSELPATITRCYLTTLVLNDSVFDDELPVLLDHLELPNLRHLSYRVYVEDGARCPLLTFLQNQISPILLETLNIHTTSLESAQFLECLRLMPELRRLVIIDLELLTSSYWDAEKLVLNDEILLPLTPSHSQEDQCLSPKLTYFHCPRACFSENAIMEFVKGRVSGEFADAGIATLRTLRLGLTYPQGDGVAGSGASYQATLRELGVEAQINYSPEEVVSHDPNPANDGLRFGSPVSWLHS